MEWKDHVIKSDSFDRPSGHQNPNSMPVTSYTRQADVVRVGAFSLSKGQLHFHCIGLAVAMISDFYSVTTHYSIVAI